MASRLNPYLHFPGTARQAMTFYQEVLGGDLVINTYADLGSPDEKLADNIMHSQLETPQGWTLMGSDGGPGEELLAGNNFAISLSGDDAELRVIFEKLSEGGTIGVPLAKQMWGDEFGQFVDKFGISWMVNIGSPQQG